MIDAVAMGLARDLLMLPQDTRQLQLLEMMGAQHWRSRRGRAGRGLVGLGRHAALPESGAA